MDNIPAVEWTTAELKREHEGDTFTNTESGVSWRFAPKDGIHQWIEITSSDATLALAMASKAQDTADGKRRVFTEKPKNTDVYDKGDLWVNATFEPNYNNDLLRSNFDKDKGTAFSIAHWEKTSKYTDDSKANEAKQAADNAQGAADTANQAVDSLQNTVAGLEVGLINSTTLALLEEQLRGIKNEKIIAINAWTVLNGNEYLVDPAKTTLRTRKNHFDSSVGAIITALSGAIADEKITQEELNVINAALDNYNSSYTQYQNAIENARKAIDDEIERVNTERAGSKTFFVKPTKYKKGDRWILTKDIQLLDNFYKKGQVLEVVYETNNDSD